MEPVLKKGHRKKVILLGAGGWAREHWIDVVLPDFENVLEITALVDINKKILKDSGKKLGLDSANLYVSLEKAFNNVKADFCLVVLPPHIHKKAYDLAIKKNLPILSEKPISDKYEDVIDVYRKVKRKKIKMAVIQNYRYEGPIITVKNILTSGKLGKIDYIVSRYASDYRKPGAWDVGSVYEINNPLLVEGSIHHFDMVRYLSNSNCKTIQGIGWNPMWSSFNGDSNSLNIMIMENGVKALYEGSSNEAGNINRWHQEYYRVECEKGSVTVNRDRTVRIYKRSYGKLAIKIVPTLPSLPTGHHKILIDFIKWLDGGNSPETNIDDNIQSAIMIFAAINANKFGTLEKVQNYLPKNIRSSVKQRNERG